MYLSRNWRITVGILTVLFMTAAICSFFLLRMTSGSSEREEEASVQTTTIPTYAATKTPEKELVQETRKEEAAGSDQDLQSGASEFTLSDTIFVTSEEAQDFRELRKQQDARTFRACSFLFPLTLILTLACLFIFSVYGKRETMPEGLETNLLILAAAVGFLYMLFIKYSTVAAAYRTTFYDVSMYEYRWHFSDILWAGTLSGGLVWGIRSAVSWFLAKCPLLFSLLWRLTERLKIQENGISKMLFVPFICTVGYLAFSGICAVSARAVRGYANGVSGMLAAISSAFVLLFALACYVFLDRLKDERRVQEEMIEKARVSERYRVDLITNVSHDFRTPLTSIIGYGELLKEENLSDEGRENLEKLNQKSAYLREMVDAVFELSKVQSGAVPGKRERIDLIRLLEQTIGEYDDAITGVGLSVVRRYKISAAPLLSDGIFLNQIFANLLSNAVKYTMKGTRIHVEVTDVGEEYQVRMMNVASYEMKFTEEEILERFARGDESRNTEGNGLGLAIAKTYTEALQGSFRVELDGDLFIAIVRVSKKLPEKSQSKTQNGDT